ncbi:hypothetical protein OQX61_23900 [Pedobacter sp. PLR]|uniref:hypothetical protein n=1 Tax=Pedobacter sp. PLR TaxID=2994465 RepID=UPI0022473C5A|nr:hypothetical protein [Pedobacter sp. PLR]MCX2454335.1 hypothetical protein [Pedobacter sp. PLR]
MLKIGQIGNCIEGKYVEDIDLSIKMNLSEFDAIFVSVKHLNNYVDDFLSGAERSGDLKTALDNLVQTSKEFELFYEHGGVMFISLNALPDLNESKNKNFLPEHLDRFSLLRLNRSEFEFEEMRGSVFEYVEDLKSFDRDFGLRYQYVLKKYNGSPVLRSKKRKDIVGVKQRIKNGICYVLPSFEKKVSLKDLLDFNFLESIINLIISRNKILNNVLDNIPAWVDDHVIYDERIYLDSKKAFQNDLEKLLALIEENEKKLSKYRQLKTLIFAGDVELELAVENTFRDIGFNVVVPQGNNDDLHLLDPEFNAVIEIKGANKSGATLHAMQVEKWVSNYGIENNGKIIKGILVLNAFKDKKPADRKENPFPKDMVDFSAVRKHCLMLSTDLLNVYIDFKEGLITKDEIQKSLNDTIGVFKYIPRYKS